MEKARKEMLEKLQGIKQIAEVDLEANNFENYEVKDIIHYKQEIQLINKRTGKKEKFKLYVVITENTKAKKGEEPIFEIEYLEDEKGNIHTIADLIHEYEGFESIKDIVEPVREDDERDEEQPSEPEKETLTELEAEEEKEKSAKAIDEKEENVKNIVKIEKMRHLQEIDAHTKVNYYKDIEKALGLNGVRKFVIVYSEDAKKISETGDRNSSRYSMIAVMEDGTTINLNDRLEEVKSEGKNSIEGRIQTNADENTYFENNPASIYKVKGANEIFSFENGQYGEIMVYYGTMTRTDGTKFVGTQLETTNVWPTSREVREHASDRKGIFYADDKKKEVEKHIEHGDDQVSIENSDGKENTIEMCGSRWIPGTEKTWDELSEETGESIPKLQDRFERELEKGKEPKEVLEEIEYDYGMMEHNRDRR